MRMRTTKATEKLIKKLVKKVAKKFDVEKLVGFAVYAQVGKNIKYTVFVNNKSDDAFAKTITFGDSKKNYSKGVRTAIVEILMQSNSKLAKDDVTKTAKKAVKKFFKEEKKKKK